MVYMTVPLGLNLVNNWFLWPYHKIATWLIPTCWKIRGEIIVQVMIMEQVMSGV